MLNYLKFKILQGRAEEEDFIAHIVKMNDAQFPGQDEFIIDDIMTVFLASVCRYVYVDSPTLHCYLSCYPSCYHLVLFSTVFVCVFVFNTILLTYVLLTIVQY